MNRDNINSLSSFTGASTSKNLADIEDESTSPLKAKEPEKDKIESLTPDQAMELLNSPKLKFIVYILINLIYNFNTIFVAAIPFLIDEPKFLCPGDVDPHCD